MALLLTPKDCETWLKNKLINPLTGRRINPAAKNGIYSKIEKQCSGSDKLSKKDCETWLKNQLINPLTGRRINPAAKNGIYSKFEKACAAYNLTDQCWNKEDPITYDDLTDKPPNEVIMIASSDKHKKHCFMVESLFHYYKTQLAENLPLRNPVDPSRRLTEDEIKELIAKMNKINPASVKSLKRIKPSGHKPFQLIHRIVTNANYEFYEILLVTRVTNHLVEHLGFIPGFVEPRHSGSTDISSAVILTNLYELWNKNRLMVSTRPPVCCNIHLRRRIADWFLPDGRFDIDLFNGLAYEIDQLL